MNKLSLSFDASAVPTNPVGAGRYTIDLARALHASDEVDMTVWTREGDDGRIRQAMTQGRPRGGAVRTLPKSPRSRAARLVWEQVYLSRAVDKIGADVHHGPHYTMPERCKTPVVVTIHDLTFIEHPEWHERSKVIVFRRAIAVAVRRADVLVCVSSATAEGLATHFEPRGKVVVVPHGVDRELFHPPGWRQKDQLVPKSQASEDDEDIALLARAGVGEPYVLFVGTLEPRKAIPDLIAAFDLIAERHEGLSLVIAGGRGWGTEDVEAAVARSRHGDRVRLPGYVSDQTVAALMRRAAVVAYPAIEEGFGLPALEALACGTPLVTTVGSAMADVAGGAALLVPARDVGSIAEALEKALSGDSEVRTRIAKGLEIANAHSWAASARGHLDAYRLAISSR